MESLSPSRALAAIKQAALRADAPFAPTVFEGTGRDRTPRDHVQEGLQRIHDVGGAPTALVLNGVNLRKQRHYARRDNAYYYRSCDGYFSEGRPLA